MEEDSLLVQVMPREALQDQVMPREARQAQTHRQVGAAAEVLAVSSRLRLDSSLLEEMHPNNIGKESSVQ